MNGLMRTDLAHSKQIPCLIAFIFFSAPLFAAHTNNDFPLPPRLLLGLSYGTNAFGEGDVMAPIWGTSEQFLHGDVKVKYGDDRAWLASVGLGVRKIYQCNAILGGYLFVDYNRTSDNNSSFTILNPGIEYITNVWDGHLNGYFPISHDKDVLNVFTGSQLGIPNSVFFSGHTQYDTAFNFIENVGPGTDVEFGYTFNHFEYLNRVRAFVGGYYFSPQYTSNIHGVEAGFEMPISHLWTFEVRDSYDNINKNTFLLTMRLSLGGVTQCTTPNIHDRILDRIPRHLGNLSNGDGIPSQKRLVRGNRVVLNNIWFFNPDTADGPLILQNGTYENPFFGLTQQRIDQINALAPGANFYLNSGTYLNPAQGLAFSFRNGQNVYGRTNNFAQLAQGNDRPLLNDSIFLEGNNNIYNLRVDGHSIIDLETGGITIPFQVGGLVRSFASGPVNIYNSDFNVTSTTNNAAGLVNNSNVTQLNVFNSSLTTSITNVAGSIAVGAANLHSGGFNLNNSFISASNVDVANNFSLTFGFVNDEAGLVNINNVIIMANLTHGGLVAGVLNNSTTGGGLGTMSINHATIQVTSNDAGITGGVFNQANNVDGISANVNVNNSNISLLSINNGGGQATGVFTSGTGIASVDSTLVTVSGDSGTLGGLVVGDATGTLNFKNSIISVNPSGTAVGSPTLNAGTLNNNGGNICFVNGVMVAC